MTVARTAPLVCIFGLHRSKMAECRAADDLATIKAHLEELRRERERERAEKGLPSEPPSPGNSSDPIVIRWLTDAAG
jgi:hypothetical protein